AGPSSSRSGRRTTRPCRTRWNKAEKGGTLAMKRWLLAVGDWFDARLHLRSTLLPMMRHPIPREVAGPMGWWYVFGSASLTLLMVQILTGIGLSLVFVPSADQAYDSLLP